MSISLDGETYDYIVDTLFSEINDVSEPTFLNQDTVTLDETIWNKKPFKVTYILRLTSAERWTLDQLLLGHTLITLVDSKYGINDNVWVESINTKWAGDRNWAKPWETEVRLIVRPIEYRIITSNPHSNEVCVFYGSYWKGQTFTPSETHTLVKIVLKMDRYGYPAGNIIVSIRNTDENGKPIGDDLTSSTISADSLPRETGQIPINFVFDPIITLQANVKYAVVFRCPDGDGNNHPRASDDNDNHYVRGTFVYSDDGGTTWLLNTGYDWWFEEWGNV